MQEQLRGRHRCLEGDTYHRTVGARSDVSIYAEMGAYHVAVSICINQY